MTSNRPNGTKGGAELEGKTALETGSRSGPKPTLECGKLQRSPFIPILVLHILRRQAPKEETLNTAMCRTYVLRLLDNIYMWDACDTVGVPVLSTECKHTRIPNHG
jgi:hypothetical protein